MAYALAALVAFVLFLTWASLRVQIALAGFLNGESVWSKAHSQATIALLDYSLTGNESDYARFRGNLDTLQAFRRARDMILAPRYNYAAVEAELKRARTMPVAIPSVIFVLRHFHDAPYLGSALRLWRATDARVDELAVVGAQLHAAYAAGTMTRHELVRQTDRINDINAAMLPGSEQFSLRIAHGAVWAGRVVFVGVVLATVVAFALWLLLARRVLAGIRGSEERYRVLFDSAPDAIVMVAEDSGLILDANRTAGTWTGRDPRALQGAAYAGLFDGDATAEDHRELRGHDGTARPVETQSSMTVWGDQVVRQSILRDITERVQSERARRVASEALASIAEGVVITDHARRVLSVNAAASQITGFSAGQLVGAHLEDFRCTADGGPLPDSIWNELAASHHWSGEVQSRHHDGGTYSERLSISTIRDADGRVLHYVAVFSDVSVAKADRRRLEHLAAHDPLTGLLNRAEFQRRCEEAIARAVRERGVVSVLFIDLDAFKFVNDSYSHAVGDSLLKRVAERIRAQVGEGGVAGRIGGDEFTVLMPGQVQREDAAALTGRLLRALSEPFQVAGYEITLSASIGVAGYPLDGADAQTLLGNADTAMHVAKSEERNACRFYVPMMQADTRHRMLLATEMRQALLNDEFHLVFQPSVEMRSGRIAAVEALLRWRHPDRGEVMPGEFIPIAESTGVIHRIDEWVMRAACAQIRAWDAADMPPIRVAINVSARWLGHPGFIESIRRALAASNVAPERIALEITEGAMLRLGEETERTMSALDALGIRVAIDDFGTGYASMAYLKLPAVEYLKIDRSFIGGLPGDANDGAIVGAMLAMAGSLGLTTIAEGIEDEAQHEFLVRAGCAEGQGYLYARPLEPAALERMLRPRQTPAGAHLRLVPRRG